MKSENWILSIIAVFCMLIFISSSNVITYLGNDNISVVLIDPLEDNGGVPVNIQDQTTNIVDLYIHQNRNGTQTINSNNLIDSQNIIINSDILPVNDNIICLKENKRFYQGKILSFTGTNPYNITLDTPLDYAYTTNSFLHLGEHDLSVNGAVTKQIYHISPPNNTQWDITRLIMHIEDNVVMDSSKFGGISALTKGIFIRKKNGDYKNIFNVKTNGEISERSYDVEYDPKAPAGVYGFRARSSFGGQDKRGVVIRLNGSDNDELQIIVQDDLTGLSHLHFVLQGHVVTN